MMLINFAAGFCILLFLGLSMALISRLNSLSEQRNRILLKLSDAVENEKKLDGSSKLEEPAEA